MLLNFMPCFVEPIRARTKLHTLRRPRRDGKIAQPGETLHLYTGLRQPGAYRIVEPLPCHRSQAVLIHAYEGWIEVDGAELDQEERWSFTAQDGFETEAEFWQHWGTQIRRTDTGGRIELRLIGWRAEDVRHG